MASRRPGLRLVARAPQHSANTLCHLPPLCCICSRGIRYEYQHYPDAAYASGRSAVLRALLAKPRLFLSPTTPAAAEAAARENLQRELAALAEQQQALGAAVEQQQQQEQHPS